MARQKANTFKSPVYYTITNPKGIDRVIQDLQTSFVNNLPWIEKSFGRAYKMTRKRDDSEQFRYVTNVLFPAVWQGTSSGDVIDLMNVLENDNLNAYSFFEADSEETVIDYEEDQRNIFERQISLIVWANLLRIDSDNAIFTDKSYNYIEDVKTSVVDAIKDTRFNGSDSVEVERIVNDVEDVFSGYTIDLANSQNLTYPYQGFRIYLTARYTQDC